MLLTEDLAERPGAVARQAFAFLDVDPDVELPPPSPANVAGLRATLDWRRRSTGRVV